MSVFHRFHEQLRDAIVRRLGWSSLRRVQEEAGEALLDGKNTIILAPTAGGKTEASFFPVLSEILRDKQDGLQVLYVAPLKALLNNQAGRLADYTEMVGLSRCVWHGDIGQSRRKKFLEQPDTVLMTTPESLEVMLVSERINHLKLFGSLRFVIIDEIHALAGSDRGTHLRSVLNRIFACSGKDVQRIGLSATVGNPEEILQWLSSDSSRPGIVINPPAPKSPKEILVVHRDSDTSLAKAVAYSGRGYKSLLFCQSRALAEKIAERMGDMGVETYVHHSSISKEERAKAEELFQKEGAACIVCTSTLELGIDIGDLDKVFQAEAPITVSSFLQRMGRTGRRAGKKANTTFFCSSHEGVLQASALVELAREGWVEDVVVNPRSWFVLCHQVLTICMSQGGTSIRALWESLSRVPDFSRISEAEFYRLIKHMLTDESLVQLDGRLLLGPKAERLFGKFNFINLYVVFSSPQTYQVETVEKYPIGQLAQDFVDQLNEEGCFILGGKAWAIKDIRHGDRRIVVTSAPRGKQPTWGGILPQFLSFKLSQKIKQLLLSSKQLPYLNQKSADLMSEAREAAQAIIRNRVNIVASEDRHSWYTYAGGHINSTLCYALRTLNRSWKITANNFSVEIKGSPSFKEIEESIDLMKEADFWSKRGFWRDIVRSLPQYRLSKFQSILPQWAAQEMLADHLLDLKGTWQFLKGETEFTASEPVYPAISDTVKDFSRRRRTESELPVYRERREPKPLVPQEIVSSTESQLKLPIYYIATDEELKTRCDQLSEYKKLGVDCETTIYPPQRMCLLQIACKDFIVLIDPLTVKDLSPLTAVLESEKNILIIHNAPFERRFLKQHSINIKNVYDTLTVSRRLRGKKTPGGEKIPHGLGYVCKRELSLNMDKGEQASNWARRPLTPGQLSYAALDAEVMLQLYDLFVKEEEEQNPSLFGIIV